MKVELDWLKKTLPNSVEARRRLIDPGHPDISLRSTCMHAHPSMDHAE